MTDDLHAAVAGPAPAPGPPAFRGRWRIRGRVPGGTASWLPTWDLIATKQLELRRRRGLMVVVVLLTVGLPVLVLGLRLLFHAVDPRSYGPAGSPTVFAALCNPMAEFGFIIAATLGASAGTTDLVAGVFRHLVITGRSRLSLYLARIPAGLSIVLPLVAVAFLFVCLVTDFAGTPPATSINYNGLVVPVHLNETQLKNFLLKNSRQADMAFGVGPASAQAGTRIIDRDLPAIYGDYLDAEPAATYPPDNEMAKIGLWIELEVAIGFLVGLGLGSLTGQRTLSTILMIVLEIIITPILVRVAIPYFLDGQRLIVGVAMDQLRPAGLAGSLGGGGRVLFGARGVLQIPPMPTWAMVAVIVGWIVVWSVAGAWRMATRDA
ncbi:MAG TPA: hypothetical protein VED84_06835 [Acidimicrobiales bacterium]|nr:hypothetical protein [Acidimicrobiales bacterium]